MIKVVCHFDEWRYNVSSALADHHYFGFSLFSADAISA
jgi:hypothetical protein